MGANLTAQDRANGVTGDRKGRDAADGLPGDRKGRDGVNPSSTLRHFNAQRATRYRGGDVDLFQRPLWLYGFVIESVEHEHTFVK